MGWFNREAQRQHEDKGNDGGTGDIELKPSEVKSKLEKIDSIETKFGEMQTSFDAKMQPVIDFIASQSAEKAAAAKKIADERRAAEANIDATDWIDDPEGATRKLLQPTNQALLVMAARATKQDVLNEKEYYHGDFKSKVDALIAQQPLKNQCDVQAIENCYKVVLADHITEINEGKLKTRAQAAIFDSKGTGGHSGRGAEEEEDVLTPQEEIIAGKFGMNKKEWAAARKEVQYV